MKAPRKRSLLLTNEEIGDQKSQRFMEVKIIMMIIIIILIIIEIKIIIVMMMRIKIIEENVMGRRGVYFKWRSSQKFTPG